MMYGTDGRFEGFKALLSMAVIASGMLLSNVAASGTLHSGYGPVDVVGLWRWVVHGEDQALDRSGPIFEIRRSADGRLEAISARSGDHVRGADVSVDDGQVCMVTQNGASFSGKISDDGLRIRGTLRYGGERSSAVLERVEHRKLRRAAGHEAYAT